MLERQYIRHGHYVDINVEEESQNKWRWRFMIDGEHYTEQRELPCQTLDLALLEAQFYADREAELMPRGDARE